MVKLTETSPDSLNGDPNAAVLKSMRRIAQAIEVRSREIARTSGLTIPQLIVMQSIRKLGQVTTQAVSREASMSPATVVAVLDKLETKGLIERYRSDVDRRVVHTRLTPGGESALRQAPGLLSRGFEDAFAALPPDRRDVLLDAMVDLADMMTAHMATPRDAA
ncbi:MAG: MarR family transcriptional regulator [Brevundimonas sp.]